MNIVNVNGTSSYQTLGSGGSGGGGSGKSELSIPKVLHYLQSEWRKFELERDSWNIERAELMSKVAVLEGERRGLENVKADLLKRIKMLEYALRQERLKLLHSSSTTPSSTLNDDGLRPAIPVSSDEDNDSFNTEAPSHITTSTSAASPSTQQRDHRLGLVTRARQDSTRSRDVLKAYLKEVNTLCLTSKSGKSAGTVYDMFNVDPAATAAVSVAAASDAGARNLSSSKLPADTSSGSDQSNTSISASVMSSLGFTNMSTSTIVRDVPIGSRGGNASEEGMALSPSTSMERLPAGDVERRPPNTRRRKESLTQYPNESDQPLQRSIGTLDEQPKSPTSWKMKHTLRHHVDSVRMVDVHISDNILATASEDHTVKLWQYGHKKRDGEPYLTLRAHEAPVLAVAFDAHNDFLFSGGADSSLFLWKLTKDRTPYMPFDKRVFLTHFDGHTDAIWDLKMHPLNPLLASCSADGTVRLWDTQHLRPPLNHLLRTNGTPTSVAFVPTDRNKMLVSLSEGRVMVVDIETMSPISSFDAQDQAAANRVVVHPTMPLAMSVHDDGSLLFTDWATGGKVHRLGNAHPTSAAAIDVSPTGLTVATGGHDCSLRVWDIGSRSCLHETTGHRKRRDEGLWSVRFGGVVPGSSGAPADHAVSAILATAGADGLVKVFNAQ
ncbi:WD40-repeat-containing domain protein [Catenaria anguillulae PL171]|uniref:WD40-repeat-containing domain protein n=1 Tax=Catenaria anguillulae PL171 TaxID=765915 RepID=A0A1Y2HWU8_9FUNG|nr:WD40-repeat-containing domain protein [Catenaria anguillulae PL171]